MPRAEAKELVQRSKDAWRLKDQWRAAYEDAYTYAQPQRDPFQESSPGATRGLEVFDSTAMISTSKFANKFVSGLFPAGRNWVKLEPGPGVPDDEREELAQLLDTATATMFAIIHHVSDFQTAIGELGLDLAVGTGAMLIQPTRDPSRPIIYEAIPQVQVALEEGPSNTVSGVFRNLKVRTRNLKRTWSDGKFSDDMKKAEGEQPNKQWSFIEATYDDPETGVWYYDVLEKRSEKFIVRRTYDFKPWATPRYMKAPGEVNGRGPLLQAMPDVKTLNKLVELVLKNAAIAVSGVYTGVDDGTFNPSTVSLDPGTILTVSRNPGHPAGPSLAPLERSGDFEVSTLEQDRLVASIRRTLLDEGLPPSTGAVRSATEIIERAQEISEQIGATFGRVVSELMIPIIERTIDILVDAKVLELPSKVRVSGSAVKVTVTSPLAQLQNLDNAKAVIQWYEILVSLLGPEMAMLHAKVEDIGEFLGEMLGVPRKLMRSESEREEIRQAVAQMLAQQQAQQQAAAEQQGQGAEPNVPRISQARVA